MKKINQLRFMAFTVFTMFATAMNAQYKDVYVKSTTVDYINIVEVVQTEESTYFYMTASASEDATAITLNPKTNIVIGYKKYPLKNCYNITSYNEAEPSALFLGKKGQTHNFILEFPYIPLTETFDILEDAEEEQQPWKWQGVKVSTTNPSDVIDPNEFMQATPAMITGRYATEGTLYSYYIKDGLVLTANFAKSKAYGKYYTVYLDIINNTGHSVLFDTDNVDAQGYTIKKEVPVYFPLETLSADEYDKKVRNRQAWSSFFNALGESSAARNAGTTTINNTTISTTSGGSYTTSGYSGSSVSAGAAVGTGGAAVGVGASAYSGTGFSDTQYSGSTTTNSSTVIHDGAVEYMAQQNARNNIAAYNQDLANARASLWQNYLKINTIKTGQHYGGFFNIKYKKADGVDIKIKIDGEVYLFKLAF